MTMDRRNLVTETADRIRDLIFAVPAGERIGSLSGLTGTLGVGTVTLQQAMRVLEHEGLIESRRGPGGGYYGTRPDDMALERALSAYLRARPASFGEALDITSLLFIELAGAAATCRDQDLMSRLITLAEQIDPCDAEAEKGAFETAFQDLLFHMVDRPLFELLTRVTLRYAATRDSRVLQDDPAAIAEWKAGRHRIIAAIAAHDPELARFEADRSNRRMVLARAATH